MVVKGEEKMKQKTCGGSETINDKTTTTWDIQKKWCCNQKSGYCMPLRSEEGCGTDTWLWKTEASITGEPSFFHHGLDFWGKSLSAVSLGKRNGIRHWQWCDTASTKWYATANMKWPTPTLPTCSWISDKPWRQETSWHWAVTDCISRWSLTARKSIRLIFWPCYMAMWRQWNRQVRHGFPEFETYDMNIATQYDKDQKEIEELMLRLCHRIWKTCIKVCMWHRNMQSSRWGTFYLVSGETLFLWSYAIHQQSVGYRAESHALHFAKCRTCWLRIFELSGIAAWHLSVHIERSSKKTPWRSHKDKWHHRPLAELDIDVQSFDIPRLVSVYPDRAGVRWWTKAWFNNREEGECSVEIELQQAILFIHDRIEKDSWLEEYFQSRWKCIIKPSSRQENRY